MRAPAIGSRNAWAKTRCVGGTEGQVTITQVRNGGVQAKAESKLSNPNLSYEVCPKWVEERTWDLRLGSDIY